MYLVFLNFPTQPQIQLKQFAAFLKEMLLLSTEKVLLSSTKQSFLLHDHCRYF